MRQASDQPTRDPEPPGNGAWRTILSAIESNSKTVRLIAIILVLAKATATARTGW
jgi:hypothetical protein